MQMHLDFFVEDLAAADARVLAAGARKYDEQPNADHCLVYADPAGHPFCLTTWDDVPRPEPAAVGTSPAIHIGPHSFGTTSRQAGSARWRHGWTIRARPVSGGVPR